MTIQLTQARVVSGSVSAAGSQVTLSEADEAYFVQNGWATYVTAEPAPGRTVPAFIATSPSGVFEIIGKDGNKLITSESGAHIYNYDSKNYKKSRLALAKVRAGTANASIARIGDSTEAGKSSTIVRANSISNLLASKLNEAGVFGTPASALNPIASIQSWYGESNFNNLPSYDSRITFGGGTTYGFGASIPGGVAVKMTAAGSSFTFTPTTNVDTFDIWYLDAFAGSWTWAVGANTATITQVNDGTFKKVTVTGASAATTPLVITWVSGQNWIAGTRAYNSAVKEVSIAQLGVNSWSSVNWSGTGSAYSPLTALPSFAFDLTFIRLGINDVSLANLSQYRTNMQSLITALKTTGDVVLETFNPTSGGASELPYIAAIFDLATTNNLAVIDHYGAMESYAISQPLGYYNDTAHLSIPGCQDISKRVFNFLRTF